MSSAGAHEDYRREYEVTRSTNRSFGIVMTVAFAVIALLPLVKGGAPRIWAAAVAAVFLGAALLAPRLLEPANVIWFKLGLLIGRITTPIVLMVLYYGIFTPMGLWLRLTGKDVLRCKKDPKAASYWIPRTPPGPAPATLKHQF